jgi:putative addiction module component (TIGR02574 family)
MAKNDEIFRTALSLPEETRAELADRLLQSLDETGQEAIDALWAREAEDRIAAFERGEVSAIPGEEVFASLRFRRRA